MLDKIETELKLKIMYILTIVVAGIIGLMMLIIPDSMISLLSLPDQDPYFFGFAGAI
ncbi:MAG: hypothetical protein HWN81_22080 [Candidatus Lokiarchaeota archaeon]|nr:hypothetical protein [Candidatus Lokiarchaeota archaeon]